MHGYVLFKIKCKPIFVTICGSRIDISGCQDMSIGRYLLFLRTMVVSPSGSISYFPPSFDSTLKMQAIRNLETSLLPVYTG